MMSLEKINELKNYGKQLQNIGIQVQNIGMQLPFIQNNFSAELQNMGMQISNFGVNIFNIGLSLSNNFNMGIGMPFNNNNKFMNQIINQNNNFFDFNNAKKINVMFLVDDTKEKVPLIVSENIKVKELLYLYCQKRNLMTDYLQKIMISLRGYIRINPNEERTLKEFGINDQDVVKIYETSLV